MDPISVLRRYNSTYDITSSLDPVEDIANLISYLTCRDYLIELARSRHNLTWGEETARAKSIIPHVQTGLQYVEQCVTSPKDVCFLPGYYAILNFLKVYVLLGPHHSSLPKQRWHGASYDGYEKDSRSLMTEKITLKDGGALPLFYQTVTGQSYPPDTTMQMRDIYPYVLNIGAEYRIAEGSESDLAMLRPQIVPGKDGKQVVRIAVEAYRSKRSFDLRHIKALSSDWKRVGTDPLNRKPPM